MTLLILEVKKPDGFILQTTLNSLPPCPRATLNVSLSHPLVAFPPPELKGRQFPWKPPVEVFLFFPPLARAEGSVLSLFPAAAIQRARGVCVCLCVFLSIQLSQYLRCARVYVGEVRVCIKNG